jgi:hypothetical protein
LTGRFDASNRNVACKCLRVPLRNVVFAFITALVAAGCGGAAAAPTSPTVATVLSNQVAAAAGAAHPSLVGAWRGFVSSRAVRAGLDATVGFALSCSQRWEITSQSGAQFEGRMWSEGSGAETDWRCAQTRSVAGEITPDNRVTISFSPSFIPGGCASVAGGDRATGSRSGDTIVVNLPYRATCEMAPNVGAPSLDLEIAATLTLTPW